MTRISNKLETLLMLAIPTLSLFTLTAGCRSNPAGEQAATPAIDLEAELQPPVPEPVYVPIAESTADRSTEYVLSGLITSAGGELLAEAMISVSVFPPRWSPPDFGQPPPLYSQASDSDGRYEIRMTVPANIWVSVRKEGYAALDVFLPVRAPKFAIRNFELQSAQAGAEGFVLDKEDKPVAGALVAAHIPSFVTVADNPVLSPVAHITNEMGQFRLDGLPDGDAFLVASARGHLLEEKLLVLRTGLYEQVTFNLPPISSYSFVVKNSRGEALPYAIASATGYFRIAGGNSGGMIEFSVSQDLSPFDCMVSADGYKSRTILLDPKNPPSEVLLEEIDRLQGRILTSSGAAIEGALVTVYGKGGVQGKFDGAVKTDSKGGFALPLYYPPVQEIKVARAGFFDQRLTYEDAKPAPPEVVIRMQALEAGIFGRVINEKGLPVKRFVLHMRDLAAEPGSQEYQRSFTNESGEFRVTDIAPGVYDLVIQSVPELTAEDVQLVKVEQVEVRKGYMFGEILAKLPRILPGK